MPPTHPGAGAGANPGPSASIDQHIASSNATANAFLGGRQPSWMTGNPATKRPISRRTDPRPLAPPTVFQHQQPQQQQSQPVLPSPAPSDEPSPALSNLLESPRTTPAVSADAHTTTPTIAAAASAAPYVCEARFVPRSHDPGATESPQPAVASTGAQVGYQRPAVGHMEGGNVSPPPGGLGPPRKRRRTDPPPAGQGTTLSMLPVLEQYIQSWGGINALEPSVERPRIMLLQRACREGDEFFIVVHQLLCIWSLNRQEAHASLPLSHLTVDMAFAALEELLRKNDAISPAHKTWLSRFPVPPGQFSRGAIGGPKVIMQIASFLVAFVNHYPALIEACMQRRYPFLVDELLGRLNCTSPLLQLILFTACRRRLGVSDIGLGAQLEQAFLEDQNRHRGPSTGLLVDLSAIRDGDMEQRNAALIDFYKRVVETAAAGRTSNQPNLPSPSTPNTPVLQHPVFIPGHGAHQQAQVSSPYYAPGPVPAVSAVPVLRSQPDMAAALHTDPQATAGAGAAQTGPQATPRQTFSQHRQPLQIPSLRPIAPTGAFPFQQAQGLPPQYFLQQQQQQQQAIIQSQQQRHPHHPQQYQFPMAHGVEQVNQQYHQLNVEFLPGFPAQPSPHSPAMSPASAAPPPCTVQSAQTSQGPQPHPQPHPQHPLTTFPIPHYQLPTLHSNIRPASAPRGLVPIGQPPAQRVQGDAPQRPREPRAADLLMPANGRFIAQSEFPHDPSDRKSFLMSLHQAHVRSPKRVAREGETQRLYEAVQSLPLGPVAVAPKKTLYEFRFEVTEAQFALAATRSKRPGTLLPVVEHFDGALRWRVRCCAVPPSAEAPTEEGQWVTYDTRWPAYITMTLNQHVLDIRRRAHHGRDLPADITDHVVRGTNVLLVSVHDSLGEVAANRHLAVETLETLRHSTVTSSVRKRGMISDKETLAVIKKRLAAPVDDDVSFEAPDLSIDLADPFTATIFALPVRGVGCRHMECFDLETWLTTRPAKPAPPPRKCPHKHAPCLCPAPATASEPSNPDKWRCPICSGDARPGSLRIDGFLLKVRTELANQGKLRAKRLRVAADGSWSAVLDDEAESDGEDGAAGESKDKVAVGSGGKVRASGSAGPGPRREVEVIELD